MTLSTKVGGVNVSLTVDTGAEVNLLSEESYMALKRNARGGRWPLRQGDMNLEGVTGSSLGVIGMITLPLCLGKGCSLTRMDFYVVTNFQLPSDGLLGLSGLKAHRVRIEPKDNLVIFRGKKLKAMDVSMPLAPKHVKSPKRTGGDKQGMSSVIPSVHVSRKLSDPTENWKTVRATVVGNHSIPDRFAMHIPVSVPEASVGSDICLAGPGKLCRLAVEATLTTVAEGHVTAALVVNTSGVSVRLKHGTLLGEGLVYDRKVVPEPLEFPNACVASARESCGDIERGQVPTLSSLVNVVDYPERKHSLLELMGQYRDVIALPGEPLGATDRTEHHIQLLKGTKPVYVPSYRLPHSQREVVNKQIQEMLDQGVIQHSRSPWNSPLFLVPKKDGGFRPVIDFRKLNAVTEDDRYPLPVLKDLLMSLGRNNQVFSSLDLLSGYWQVPMAESSRAMTAFSTNGGHYEWLRMPFGLKSAPLTFQRMMNSLFSGMIGDSVFVYLDDIIVASKDLDSHFTTLRSVFQRLQEAGLKVKLSKCEFLKAKICFLGHTVDGKGIHTMDDKVLAVKNFPQPKSVDNVRSFIGLAGYYRPFIKDFAKIASPLNKLLKKNATFHWDAPQERSFQELKFALTHAPVLAFPDFSAPFELCTDASSVGLGAVLMQKDQRGKNHVIAYASRVLTPAESNYSVTHQEALAVVWALRHFKDLIYGYPVTVFTDHVAVTELFKGRNLSGRLARWSLIIQDFRPEFKYLPGRANVVADSLSRNVPIGAVKGADLLENFSIHELGIEQRKHDVWGKVIYALESGDETSLPVLSVPFPQFFLSADRVLCRHWSQKTKVVEQFVIPEVFVPTVLKLVHDMPMAGHPGRDRTLAAARRTYYWPTMRVDIEDYVARCVVCAQHKGSPQGPAPILEYPAPEQPWDVVAIDLLQLPKSTHGSQYLLVCVDHFSRYVVLAPVKTKTATAIAHALVTHLLCPYSTPRVLLSDNGAEFRNSLLAEICSAYNIKQTFTVAYHPSSNGLVERTNRKILETLRPVVKDLYENWEDWLPHVAACINGSVCESTGKSPHYILYGVDKRLPYDLLTGPTKPVYNIDNYADQHLHVFSKIHKQVREKLLASRAEMMAQQHKRAVPVQIQVGDNVMVQAPIRNSKLAPKFFGPRLVVSRLHGNKFGVLDPVQNTTEIVHSDRLKKTRAQTDTGDCADLPTDNSANSTNPPHTYNLRSRV